MTVSDSVLSDLHGLWENAGEETRKTFLSEIGVSPKRKDKKCDLKTAFATDPKLVTNVNARLVFMQIDQREFWSAAASWAERNGKTYMGPNGWKLALLAAIREGWAWVPEAKGSSKIDERRNPVQAAAQRIVQRSERG